MKGRGKVTFIKSKPKPSKQVKEDEFDTIRNESSRTVVGVVKQARRLEQIAYRLGLIIVDKDKLQGKLPRYPQLNVEALRHVRKHLDWGIPWQRKLFMDLADAAGIIGNTMKRPTMKK